MKKPKGTWQPTPAELDAFCLLFGISHPSGKQEFPSQNTSPTEKEARQALARILRSGDVLPLFLDALADQIDPDGGKHRIRRIEFKNLSQGHSKDLANFAIANMVRLLRKKKEKNAIEKVAKRVGMTPRHVARIYSKLRERCEYVERRIEKERMTPVRELMS